MTAEHGAREHVEFVAGPVRPPRRRRTLAMLGWIVALGGLVALGVSGQRPVPESAAPDPLPTANPVAGAAAARQGSLLSKRFDPAYPSLIVTGASDPGAIQFEAVRNPVSIEVQGATSAPHVERIIVTAQSLDGQPAGSQTVSMSRARPHAGATETTPAFTVELLLPARVGMRVLVVEATAYDGRGTLLASARAWLEPEA